MILKKGYKLQSYQLQVQDGSMWFNVVQRGSTSFKVVEGGGVPGWRQRVWAAPRSLGDP
jgi:hypothetical protein